MSDLLSVMVRHGYALTFALLFAEAIGLPFPAAIALVAAGAAAASHTLWVPFVLLAATGTFLAQHRPVNDQHSPAPLALT